MAYSTSDYLSGASELQHSEEETPTEPTQTSDVNSLDHASIRSGSGGYYKAQELTNGVLGFLSTASAEKLGGCVVGLAAVTYFVLGRVGLVIIGIIGGVILHATWNENWQNQANDRTNASGTRRRREAGLHVVGRVLDWREGKQSSKINDRSDTQDIDSRISSRRKKDFSDFQPATRAALETLTDAIVRDYVKYKIMISCYFF